MPRNHGMTGAPRAIPDKCFQAHFSFIGLVERLPTFLGRDKTVAIECYRGNLLNFLWAKFCKTLDPVGGPFPPARHPAGVGTFTA
ncbi:MAG: hypothetical protein RBG13Loki_0118 [Promethearchaeota archaeon CR_4]|nr:MAG: hypothetical protein RBG13Loki_0118 [Candidatus Lokiarchaeota archaeon CR_4]